MKLIEDGESKVLFSEVKSGDVIQSSNGSYYIKSSAHNHVVNLKTGNTGTFNQNDYVTPKPCAVILVNGIR